MNVGFMHGVLYVYVCWLFGVLFAHVGWLMMASKSYMVHQKPGKDGAIGFGGVEVLCDGARGGLCERFVPQWSFAVQLCVQTS